LTQFKSFDFLNEGYTCGTAEEILVPPEAPKTKIASPAEFTTIKGLIEERGIFPGTMKFSGDGGTPNALVIFGAEKSSISSLRMIPVRMDLTFAPKLSQAKNIIAAYCMINFQTHRRFMVLVAETAEPSLAITDTCAVPWFSEGIVCAP
jgi:hypothetical protein